MASPTAFTKAALGEGTELLPHGSGPQASGSRGNPSDALLSGEEQVAMERPFFPLGPGLDRLYLCICVWMGMSEQSVLNLQRSEFCDVKRDLRFKSPCRINYILYTGLKV